LTRLFGGLPLGRPVLWPFFLGAMKGRLWCCSCCCSCCCWCSLWRCSRFSCKRPDRTPSSNSCRPRIAASSDSSSSSELLAELLAELLPPSPSLTRAPLLNPEESWPPPQLPPLPPPELLLPCCAIMPPSAV